MEEVASAMSVKDRISRLYVKWPLKEFYKNHPAVSLERSCNLRSLMKLGVVKHNVSR